MCAKQLNVLIGGGRGFIGSRLRRMLLDRGHKVTVISRNHGPGAVTWNHIDTTGLPAGTNAVVNVAGENLMNQSRRWNDEFVDDLHNSRIETNQSLIHAISRTATPPKVFISASAVGYYKADPAVCYTETSPSTGKDFMSQLCSEWEKSAQVPQSINTRQVVIRIGLVLGRDGGMVGNLIMPFFCGVGGPIGSGKQWFPWIHVEDVAGIFTHAIENDGVTGILNAVAPAKNTNREFATAFGRAMWRPAILPLPGFVLTKVFGPERSKAMLEGQQVFPERTLEMGYEFVYPDLPSACKEFSHILPNTYAE